MARSLVVTCVFLMVWSTLPFSAQAQTVRPLDTRGETSLYARVGTDYSLLTATLGASHRTEQFEFFGHALLPTAELGEIGLLGGARLTLGQEGWRVPLELGLVTRRVDNRIMRAWGIALIPSLAPGYYSKRWLLSLNVAFDVTLLSHIRHEQFYRDVYHEGAQDGWYTGTARSWMVGMRSAWRFNDSWSITAQGGTRASGAFSSFLPSFYALLGAELSL